MKALGLKPATPAPTGPLPRIVYVEDEEQNWELTQFRLQNRYDVLRARTAEELHTLLQQDGPPIVAILMDIQLKGSTLDGVQLTRLLRGTLPQEQRPPWAVGFKALDVPILFLTAYGARYSEAELKEYGGDLILYKPVDFIKLSLSLAQLSLRKVLQPGA